MQYIKAPYNFVPISEKVVFPEWGNAVSHDIPFEDGESGTITVKITAKSPIFVRNGNTDKENKTPDFSHHNSEYFIPGSSLKGAIRNVMEIMSFGKMGRVNNVKYAVRDFQNRNIYLNKFNIKDIRCGWLSKNENDDFVIQDCGFPGRIDQKDLSSSLYNRFQKSNSKEWGNSDYNKSAAYKYHEFDNLLNISDFKSDREDNGRKIFVKNGSKKGRIVFTGQPGKNDCKKYKNGETRCGKHFEFIFFTNEGKEYKLTESVFKNFKQAYFENDKNNWSEDWKWVREILFTKGEIPETYKTENINRLIPEYFKKNKKVPVFFRLENDKVKDLGLSYLYKITYNNSIKDLLPDNHKPYKFRPDLPETIFGYIQKDNALKGRVHFSHAFLTENIKKGNKKQEVLSSPKATYYPNYIRQKLKGEEVNGDYKTYHDSDAKLAGWKIYPIHSNDVESNRGTSNVSTEFIPLVSGAEFELKIRVHNLKKIELGALISALTHHNTPNTFHGIGMAKPLGYGKVKFEIINFKGFSLKEKDYMEIYEVYMNKKLKIFWHQSEQIVEFITMMTEQNNKGEAALKYMSMSTQETNEFVKAKGNKKNNLPKEALKKYSDLNGIVKKRVISLVTGNEQLNIGNYDFAIDFNELKKTTINDKREKLKIELKNKLAEFKNINFEIPNVNKFLNSIDNDILRKEIEIRRDDRKEKASSGLKDYIEKVKNKKNFNIFKEFQNLVKQYLKALQENSLPKSDYEYCITILSDIYNNSSKHEIKLFSIKYIRVIEKWLGKPTAQKWFDEIQKQ